MGDPPTPTDLRDDLLIPGEQLLHAQATNAKHSHTSVYIIICGFFI